MKKTHNNEVEFIIIAWAIIIFFIATFIGSMGLDNLITYICSKTNEVAFLLYSKPTIIILNIVQSVLIFFFSIYFFYKTLMNKKFIGAFIIFVVLNLFSISFDLWVGINFL